METIKIPLHGKYGLNKFTLIDKENYYLVIQYRWYVNTKGYVITTIRGNKDVKRQTIKLHRLILDIKNPEIQVDHINHDKLDNTKNNLRLCTNQENSRNRKKNKDNLCKYKGVYKNKKGWSVEITDNDNNRIYGGYFSDVKIAALRYDQLARKHYKQFAHLNFPEIENYEEVEEQLNKHKLIKTSRHKYIHWDKKRKRWKLYIKNKYYGSFLLEEEAYNKKLEILNEERE